MKRSVFFIITIGAMVLVETVSWVTFRTDWAIVALAGIGVFLMWAVVRYPAVGLYASLGELCIGGRGYLLSAEIGSFELSLRHVVFLVVAVGTLRLCVRKESWEGLGRSTLPGIAFLVWALVSAGWGLAQGYPPSRVFTDMNAFLYLLLWPAWLIAARRDKSWESRVMLVLLAGVIILGVKSWLLMTFFSHAGNWPSEVYRWIRDSGVGEITPMTKSLYRVFMPSQIYALLTAMSLAGLWILRRSFWVLVPWMLGAAAVWISLSRSFWLGAAIGFVTWVTLVLVSRQVRRLVQTSLVLTAVVGMAFVMFSWAINFPRVFPAGGEIGATVSNRLRSEQSSEAANARRNQIQPLLSEISQNPVFGRGFGAQARYYNPDPRIRGWRETSAFELGYLDLWLKTGLIGVVLLGWLLYRIVVDLKRRGRLLMWGPPLMTLVAVHLTTPFINHPLGLGWIMLSMLLAYV